MRIGQVSPLYEAVPPRMYGGTERVVSYLTEELVKQGHEVTLFASGDSITQARLIASTKEALRLSGCLDPLVYHMIQMQDVADYAVEMDVIHFHTDYLHFPFSALLGLPQLTTLHGRLDLPDLPAIYSRFPNMPVVSISTAQRGPLPMADWIGTVYHGLPDSLYSLGGGQGGYVAFLGRISLEKRADRAIEIAKRAGYRIKIAAKIDKVDTEYFESQIRHLIRQPHVEYIGEIGEDQKSEFLGNAAALLFPIDWPEPFGMVMIEAMACGTPVIAWNQGSVPELLDKGITGYMVNSIDKAVKALKNIHKLDRNMIRAVFEQRFTASRMASDYVKLYEQLISDKKAIARQRPSPKLDKLFRETKKAVKTAKRPEHKKTLESK